MKKKLLYGLVIFLVVCILLFVYVMARLVKENSECLNNPLVYAANRIEDQGMPITCYCNSLDPKYAGFSFNKDGIIIDERG